MYDLLIMTGSSLDPADGGTMGGTERQILSVAESLAHDGLEVAIVHSITDGTDKIVNGVKHLNAYRHYYDYSKVRLMANHFGYSGNYHRNYTMNNIHVPPMSPIEMNCAEKTFCWFHNWFHLSNNDYPRIFNSKAVARYVYEQNPFSHMIKKLPDDKVIHYMIPKGLVVQPQEKREDYLFWMSAFGKGMKEAVLMYISLFERGLTRRPFHIAIPPQRDRKDVEVVERMLIDVNKNGYPIRFFGEMKYVDALTKLSKAACLFRPGLPQETFGLVYLEANQLGVPVLTYKGDAGEEILEDKHNMLIDKHHKLQDISNWLIDIGEQKTTVDMSKFDPDRIKKQWIKLIENA